MYYPTVGFFGSDPISLTVPSEDSTDIPESDTLIALDSGRKITMQQGTRSVAVLGGTGSGKTRSVILPMISNLIRNGLSGLILDVKGNLRSQVRAIAAAHGRLDDIIEFGTHQSANRTNFLAGLNDSEVSELMDSLATDSIGKTGNLNFYLHGGRIFYDVYRCLKILSNFYPRCHFSKQFTPTLAKIYRIVNNNLLAQGLWTFYTTSLNKVLNKYSNQPPQALINAQSFSRIVRSDNFHVLKDVYETKTHNYWDQLSYALNHINGAFKSLEITHGLLDRFSCDDANAVPLDFDKLIYQDHKIVLMHFAMDSGYAGDLLSRKIKSRYYQAVIRNGLQSDRNTFFVGDEFQAIVDVNQLSRLNDFDFFSISREYKNINIIATQSIASLQSKGDEKVIDALLSNCMTKILLQCTDNRTNEWLKTMCQGQEIPLKFLPLGACFIECANHCGSLVDLGDNLNTAYTSVDNMLKQFKETPQKSNKYKKPPYAVDASGLPYVISKILLTEPPAPDGDNKPTKASEQYASEICEKLEYYRNLSRAGLPYWNVEPYREKTLEQSA